MPLKINVHKYLCLHLREPEESHSMLFERGRKEMERKRKAIQQKLRWESWISQCFLLSDKRMRMPECFVNVRNVWYFVYSLQESCFVFFDDDEELKQIKHTLCDWKCAYSCGICHNSTNIMLTFIGGFEFVH